MASTTALPPAHLSKLSPHPFLLANLSQSTTTTFPTTPTRANHRAPHESRPVKINASSLSHAHGSAMIRIGDTAVICGVRGELLPVTSIPQWRSNNNDDNYYHSPANSTTPRAQDSPTEAAAAEAERKKAAGAREMRDYDLLVPNIELATGCAPQFLPGGPPSALAQTLSTRVYSLLHGAGMLDADDLRVWYAPPSLGGSGGGGGDDRMDEDAAVEEGHEGDDGGEEEEEEEEARRQVKAYWTLYIDVLFLSFDGSPFDAAWVAVLAALRDTRLPRAWWDADREMVLCSRAESRPLSLAGLPVACTAAVLVEREREPAVGKQVLGKTWVLVDPDREEDKLCDESVTVMVDCSGGETRVRGIEKLGGRTLGPVEIRDIVGIAEKRWEEVSKALLREVGL